ncbi:MAG: CorA family divalent cation transporter [Pseudomonadota bacterium]
MIRSIVRTENGFEPREGLAIQNAIWIDLIAPTAEERELAAQSLGISLPLRVRMRAIEPSSRLVDTDGKLVMTFSGVAQATTIPASPVTCILADGVLITVHSADSAPFEAAREFATNPSHASDLKAHDIFIDLVESSVEVVADRLEMLGAEIDQIAAQIFDPDSRKRRARTRVQSIMKRLGFRGTQIVRLQDSLTSLQRLSVFMEQHASTITPHLDNESAVAALRADVRALAEFAEALDAKIEFLMDAMLGMITLDQNEIMMLLSVVAAMFLPATLIASIFGMNFPAMPVLKWHHGFFISIGGMAIAAIIVGFVIRWRRWL